MQLNFIIFYQFSQVKLCQFRLNFDFFFRHLLGFLVFLTLTVLSSMEKTNVEGLIGSIFRYSGLFLSFPSLLWVTLICPVFIISFLLFKTGGSTTVYNDDVHNQRL